MALDDLAIPAFPVIVGYRVAVKHEACGEGSIISHFSSMPEALVWATSWPMAVEVHITPSVQREG